MEEKKKVIILVSIALVLAATAIVLNVMDSDEVPVTGEASELATGGQVNLEINPAPVEDKMAETEMGGEQ